jgi:uncharacterized protein YPO0396
MQLNVFSTDDNKNGFRLQYMEVFNWGTFDGKVHSIKPMGETSLLTGANGSGKTTFIDALLTLMVPEKKNRFYNQSSGSEKKGDRNEETYVLGGYGSIHQNDSHGTKTLYLRENKAAAYSILMAGFKNETGQEITLFQVRYFSGNDLKRYYAIAHKELHVEEHFKPFDLQNKWKKRLDEQFNKGRFRAIEWFDSASKYAQRMIDVMGMQSTQALSLFNQTVGIKVLGDLNDFIRTNMLEPRAMEDSFMQLKSQLKELLAAKNAIEKINVQIQLLQPIADHYENFQEQKKILQELQDEIEQLTLFKKFGSYQLMQIKSAQLQEAAQQYSLLIDEIALKIKKQELEEKSLEEQLAQHETGKRIQQLRDQLSQQQLSLDSAAQQLQHYIQHADQIGVKVSIPLTQAGYNQFQQSLSKSQHRLEREDRLIEEDEYAAKSEIQQIQQKLSQVEEELEHVLHHRNNIPPALIAVREQICDALKIEQGEIPFAGELMQVRSEELEWQPALEKLLYSFSLRLLVPEKHYKKINTFVNKTRFNTKLVYYRVNPSGFKTLPEAETIHDKLEFMPDHPFSEWVEQQVIQYYNYYCVTKVQQFEKYDKAITLEGLIKSKDRHEKDDRGGYGDSSKYVMGWNNARKKDQLAQKRNQFRESLTAAQEVQQQTERKKRKLQSQWQSFHFLQHHTGFQQIDTISPEQQIKKLVDQMAKLEKGSQYLSELAKQLEEVVIEKNQLQNHRDEHFGKKAIAQNEYEQYRQQITQLEVLLSTLQANELEILEQFKLKHQSRFEQVELENIHTICDELRVELDNRTKKVGDSVQKSSNQIERAIYKLKNPSAELLKQFPDWMGDVQHLPDQIQHAGEYIDWLHKIQEERLPEYKQQFEKYIYETVTQNVVHFKEDLDRWESDIQESIKKLNDSLGGIHFNKFPDTYIQLGKRASVDTQIKEFRHQLVNALTDYNEWSESSFEDKAAHFNEHVYPFIMALAEDERYRSKVLDVRNWFEFWADEIFRSDHSLKKSYRQMGQLSGGEKAQLTYTILCSAIAYQFGITKEGQNARSLRFIAVDESFSNQDEEKATYLMELCKQLHLQLLVVTPSDKIQIVENYIAFVHLVQRVNNRHSIVYNMTIKEYTDRSVLTSAVAESLN